MKKEDLLNALKKLKLVGNDVGEDKGSDVADVPPDLVNLQKDAKGPLEGFIVFYVNVGQMTPHTAEKHLKRTMESYSRILERMPEQYAAIWVPCRARETSVEVIHF